MAHEIGHIVKRHLASRMEKGKIVGMASLGMALAALAFGSGAAATDADDRINGGRSECRPAFQQAG